MKRIIVSLSILFASLLLIGGAVLAGGYYVSWHTQQVAVDKALATTASATVHSKQVVIRPSAFQGTPVKIDIPSVGISQPVQNGYYNPATGKWTLSYHAVFWAAMTAPINNEAGNTFIYGHDVPQIFGNLLNAKVGDKAVVTTDNGYEFTYTLQATKAVGPNDVSMIQPTETPQLTVQTCSGSWYQYRQMFTFTLDRYQKI